MKGPVEIWKSHPEYAGIEVSTIGRVRTLDRVTSTEKMTRFQKGRVLKQSDNGSGYLKVNIPINGKQAPKKVHRLVAKTFIPNPDSLPQVNHRDCNRDNNNVENLEWCDNSYNQKYREKHGISNAESKGHPLFAIKMATLEVLHFSSQQEAGRALGFGQGGIGAVIRGKQEYTNGLWFVNDDDNAVDLTKSKLYYVDKTRLTAADEASVDFVSKIISE